MTNLPDGWKVATAAKFGYIKERDGEEYQYSVQLLKDGRIVRGVGMTEDEALKDAINEI